MDFTKFTFGMVIGWLAVIPGSPLADAPAPERVITSTRVERTVFNTPQAITTINDKQIAEANVTATPDLFRFAEGVYIQKTNLGGGAPIIRGLTGKQVLLLVDGIRLNNSFYRFGPHQYLNTIDPNIIERIEVVRGPSSVLYGSDAMGGVINIITKKRSDFLDPFAADGLASVGFDSATAGMSSQGKAGGFTTRLQGEGNKGDFGWILGGSYKSYDDLEGGDGVGEQVPSGYDEYDVDLKLNQQLGTDKELVLGFQQTRQFDVPKTSEVTLDGKLRFNYEPQERTFSYLEYRDRGLDWFDDVKFNVSYNLQREGEDIIAALPIQTQELTEVGTIGANLQFTNDLFDNQHRLTYGVEFYHDDYDTQKASTDLNSGVVTAINPGVPNGAVYDNFGVFVQDEIKLGQRANLILGGRYSEFSAQGNLDHPTEGHKTLALETNQFTGSLQGLYGLTEQLNFVAGIAQGFRAPNMEDFFGRVDFTSEIPNTNLKPEESVNYEAGFKFLNASTFADLHFFYADYENLIDRIDTVDSLGNPVKQRRNVNTAVIQGVEGSVKYQIDPNWMVAANLTWTEGRDDQDQPLRRIPPLNGSLQVRYTYNPKIWLEFDTLLAKTQDELSGGDKTDLRIPPGGTPGYAVFSLRSGFKRTKNETLLLTFENIFDQRYKSHGSGLYAPGRSVVANYTIKF